MFYNIATRVKKRKTVMTRMEKTTKSLMERMVKTREIKMTMTKETAKMIKGLVERQQFGFEQKR